MSSTAYVHLHTLVEGHSDSINVVAFSPDGVYLASGADDHTVIIWSASKGHFLYRMIFDSPVDTLIWHPLENETIILGCQKGSIYQVRSFSLTRNEYHDINLGARGAVYSLDYNVATRCLAAAMGPEVHVTCERSPDKYSGDLRLPHPHGGEVSDDSDDARDRAVAVHFEKTGQGLIVSYLTHGIICWDLKSGGVLWRITPPASFPKIGGSALSPNFRNIVVYNFKGGLLHYTIGRFDQSKFRRLYKFDTPPSSRHFLRLEFLHNGRALVCGTTTGNVCIWQMDSGDYFQQLSHDEDLIYAVSGCQRGSHSYIATASAGKGKDTYIKIWRAKITVEDTVKTTSSFSEAFLAAVTSNNLFQSRDEFQRGLLMLATVIACISLAWASYKVGSLIPWRTLTNFAFWLSMWGIGMLQQAGKTGWLLLLRGKSIAMDFMEVVTEHIIEWARVTALGVLGLPPDILDRLPPA